MSVVFLKLRQSGQSEYSTEQLGPADQNLKMSIEKK